MADTLNFMIIPVKKTKKPAYLALLVLSGTKAEPSQNQKS